MKSLLFAIILFSVLQVHSQVGIGTTSPNASAALDITSTTGGILIPRMTSSLRSGILTPAAGLLVFDTDSSKIMQYTGTAWKGYLFMTDVKSSGISDKTVQQVIEMDNIQVRTRSDGTSGFEFKAKNAGFTASWSAETTFLATTGSNNSTASFNVQHSQSRGITTGAWSLIYNGSWTIHPDMIRAHLFDETNGRFYRITCFITNAFANNPIVIERLH